MENQTELLETLLVAQVLTLAHHLKAEKARHGLTSTSDFTQEASRLIAQKRADILRKLAETR